MKLIEAHRMGVQHQALATGKITRPITRTGTIIALLYKGLGVEPDNTLYLPQPSLMPPQPEAPKPAVSKRTGKPLKY